MRQNLDFYSAIEAVKNAQVAPLNSECVFINDSVGRILAQDIIAKWDNPRFDTSNMDGYAFSDLEALQSVGLKIASVNKAGNNQSCAVKKGECIKTFTGAKMPQNANYLAIVEQVEVKNNRIFLKENECVKEWNHIRKMGENYKKGAILLKKGEKITPFSIGILAQNNEVLIRVVRKIRIGILSGGDELIELGEMPKNENFIYSSNNHTLCAIAMALGAECAIYPLLQDSAQNIRESIASALKDNDIIITTGGMSKGDLDFTKDIVREFGECVFYGAKIKPGKVVAYIKCDKNKHIFALPGNPSSSIVSFLLFGRLVMQKMLCQTPQIPIKKGKLRCDIDNSKNTRLCFELAQLCVDEGFYTVLPRENRSSYMVDDFSGAFCILAQKRYHKGDFVDIILLDDLLKI